MSQDANTPVDAAQSTVRDAHLDWHRCKCTHFAWDHHLVRGTCEHTECKCLSFVRAAQ
jgi:hypothetical protein